MNDPETISEARRWLRFAREDLDVAQRLLATELRRRLFEPLAAPDPFKQRDVTARAFAELYRSQRVEFPSECRTADYERRIQTAYPIHPEIFDRLYTDWSALAKFQRTRGVLRLMAAVIHSLWEPGGPQPAAAPLHYSHRRRPGAQRADPLSLRQLEPRHRQGRRRAGLAAGRHRREGAQPRQALRHEAGGAHRLPRLRPYYRGGAPRHRRLPGQARLRHAGGISGSVRRRPAQTGRGGDLSLPGRPQAVVRHPADSHQTGRGPGRATGRQPRRGRQGVGPVLNRNEPASPAGRCPLRGPTLTAGPSRLVLQPQ